MSRQLLHRTLRKTASCWIGLTLFTGVAGLSMGAHKSSGPINVGMIALLASPQKYNGKVISTIGFLVIGRMPEADSLLLYEQDGKLNLYHNMLALELSDDQREQSAHIDHTYVVITGTFHSNRPGSTVVNSGTLVHITQLYGWEPYEGPSLPRKRN